MKKIANAICLVLLCATAAMAQGPKLKYSINLNDRDDDLFKVTLDVNGLTAKNAVYQFAATAPGTYQVMDIGKYVKSFKAFDKKGGEIAVSKKSVNQYELSDPKKVVKIVYTIAETWDTPVEKDPVYPMCGTSIEKDNVLINGQCVFGYPKGMQGEALEVKIAYPAAWIVGTSLAKTGEGTYVADNYDRMVDSPILLGNLTKATTTLGKASVEIYTYSKSGSIKSEGLLSSMENMLKAADAFIGGLPVDRYTFLFHFEDKNAGAWEHSYGSEYVLADQPYTEEVGKGVVSIAAHEFFHVITPLNIHSEIIEQFNFVTPTPSEHLWLYEGTTEWASDMMQLRYGLMDINGLLNELKTKLIIDHTNYDTTYSLSKLALTSYTAEGQQQYGNIYMRGALVAGLLDIRILELSNGTKGYREVIQELLKKYGAHKAFPEDEFFKQFTAMTYPEIGAFFDDYIKNAKPLPMKEYYAKLGINYYREQKTGKTVPNIGTFFNYRTEKIQLKETIPAFREFGFAEDDEVVAINGTPVNPGNVREVVGTLRAQSTGSSYTLTIKRPSGNTDIKGTVLSKEEVKPFFFEVDPQATEKQLALRKEWLRNK